MKLPRQSPALFVALAAMAAPGILLNAQVAPVSFNEQIQPILSENCYACHGPDASNRKARLRLDRAEFATAARGDLPPAIVPGKPEESELVFRITSTDEDERMPPLESHKRLKPGEVALLRRWIAEGAAYQEHWALLAPVRPAVPAAGRGWVRNPIDAFVAEKIAAAGLKPGREEAPARLLRRVAFDLTGLPPAPEEIAAFERDSSAAAYERVVDRLLASDAAAEQLTRHWLDAVRYADTHGFHLDNYRSIWPYRDWVIEAFRRNMPFDQFTIEQMAGDLLPGATLDQKVASGYNRCLSTTDEGGAIPAEYEAIYAKDRVETMSTVWLGLTTGCAACHDHKFDPISTRDFYSLTAFFRNNTMPALDGGLADTRPSLFVPAKADRQRWSALQDEMSALRTALKERAAAGTGDFERWLASANRLPALPPDHSVRLHVPGAEDSGPMNIARGSERVLPGGTVAPVRIAGFFGPAPRLNDLDAVLGPAVPLMRDGVAAFGWLMRIEGEPSGTLLSCLDDDAPGNGWELFLENGKPGMFFADGAGGVKVRPVAKQPLTTGKWLHILFTYDGAASRVRLADLFVDGVRVVTVGEAGTASETHSFRRDITPAAPLRLGARHSARGPTRGLTGGDAFVQDLRQYEQVFLVPEIKELSAIVDVAAAFEARAQNLSAAQKKLLLNHYFATVDAPSRRLSVELDRLQAEDAAIRKRGGNTLVMEEMKGTAPSAHVLLRGEYTRPGDKVSAATPAALPALSSQAPRNRLGLAQWLVTPENPLTARVTVNRAWQMIFGTGLVESAGDFGVMGARPSHPQLLDWLAVDFRDSGWDQRRLLRLLVTSATYRQSAAVTPELLEQDPANRWLARSARPRLDAEMIRDQALAASGLLVARLGGRSVRPYQPEGVWEDVAMRKSTTRFYQTEQGDNLYRRSLYTVWKRIAPPAALEIFNAPSREVACVRRDRTNTPLQALVTLNEPIFVEAARQLATRAVRAVPGFDARLDVITLRLLGRRLDAREREVVRNTLDFARAEFYRQPAAAKAFVSVGASPLDAGAPVPEIAAWTVVASQIMNLDEALTK